jgi:hypothetical protein
MDRILTGVLIIIIAFVYLTRAPSPQAAPLGCAGLFAGVVIALVAIVKLVFF